MGLFSGIKKAAKKVFKGVKKIFKSVLKKVGKVLNSKFGKALMIAAAVFTGGMALAAGFQGFAGTTGTFLTKFVSGSKAFIGALANPIGQAKEMFGKAANAMSAGQKIGAVANTGATAAETALAGGAAAAEGAASAVAGDTLLAGGANALQSSAGGVLSNATLQAAQAAAPITQVTPTLLGQAGDLARSAGGAAWEFAKTSGGGRVIAGALKGHSRGVDAEEARKQETKLARYYDNAWDPNKNAAGLDRLQASVRDVQTPRGYLSRAMDSANAIPNFTPRVTLSPAGG